MRKIMITSPLTGLSCEAIEYIDGSIVFSDKLTGEEIKLTYNASSKRYMLRKDMLKYRPVMTYQECAEMLNVSVQRVYKLVSSGKLESIKSGSKGYIIEASALKCKHELSKDSRSNLHERDVTWNKN